MPEGYTHIRTARHAAALAQVSIADQAAFDCGANGPDILFCYRVWKSSQKRGENLPELGERLHNENTGTFLQSLLETAKTPQERSYALGFLCHYATDCVLHPYVVMITQPDQLYGQPGGHGYFEIALDSYLHKQDTGRASVPVQDNTPKLSPSALDGAVTLLQAAIQTTLGVSVSRQALTDTFAHTRLLRGQFVSRLRIKYVLFWLVEPIIGHRGFITGHITPARLKTKSGTIADLPAEWIHPFTKEPRRESVGDLLEDATRRSAAFLLAAQGYWEGKLTLPHVMELIGSNSYLSGLPDAQSAPQSST